MRDMRSWLIHSAIALVVILILVTAENVLVQLGFPRLARLTTDFSPAYLRRELRDIAGSPPQTIFFGDSVLWGYRVGADQTAVAILASRGCACRNFAFKSGNSPNDYALARLFVASRIRPAAVVIEVNQAVLNEADREYQTLHPGIAVLAEPFLTPADRTSLTLPPERSLAVSRLENLISSLSSLYAMRSDIRETWLDDAAQSPMQRLTPELFEGTYNLAPLTESNVGVRYLERTADVLHAAGIPTLAFLTPTNHALLHEYIDNTQYRSNAAYLKRLFQRRAIPMLDLDATFPTNEFIDNAHLTVAGQRRLAAVLSRAIGQGSGGS
jgi:hypothetical protein